jgi:hypothetical protein
MHALARHLVAPLVALGLSAAQAPAQEFVHVMRPLTDEEFYRAVACAAPPGGECRKPFLRWPEAKRRGLTVGLASLPEGMADARRAVYDRALANAIAQVNATGAGIRLARAGRGAPDIAVHVLDPQAGEVVAGTGAPTLEGAVPPLARVALRAAGGEVREASVALSDRAPRDEIASLILEEIVQALGLMTDVAGPGTRGSIFAEDLNAVSRLEGQDADALRRHYPR